MHLIGLARMSLTSSQQKIVDDASGDFLVRACPGSGKTYTLAYKTLSDIKEWQDRRSGIAVLSFTNAARDELLDQIDFIEPEYKVAYPHFISTLDGFINKYIFFPYSYLLGLDPVKVEMIGEPFGRFYSRSKAEINSLALKYDLEGNLTPLSTARAMNGVFLEYAKRSKVSLIKRSKFTQSDANFYALKILRENPKVVESLALRFPFLYLDEAQDTTAIHWEIIKLISKSEHNKRFGVIGDPDQSIYGWNGALPELFSAHETDLSTQGQVYLLNDSRRSSQAICNFYFPMSTLSAIPTAISPQVATLEDKPICIYYSDLSEIVELANTFIDAHKSEEKLILCRSTNLIKEINASLSNNPVALGQNPWSDERYEPQALLQAKYELERGDYRSSIMRIERLVLNLTKQTDLDTYLKELDITKRDWYKILETELDNLPTTESKNLKDWSDESRDVIKTSKYFKSIELKIKNKGKIDYKLTMIADYFSTYDIDSEKKLIDTIHSAKGKTTDHVLLILGKSHTNKIIKVLSNKTDNTEEKRALYVAITRARKTVTLCAPIELKSKLDALLK